MVAFWVVRRQFSAQDILQANRGGHFLESSEGGAGRKKEQVGVAAAVRCPEPFGRKTSPQIQKVFGPLAFKFYRACCIPDMGYGRTC